MISILYNLMLCIAFVFLIILLGGLIAAGVHLLLEYVEYIRNNYGASNFATEDYVDENGNKIDIIKFNGVKDMKKMNEAIPHIKNRDEILWQQKDILLKLGFTKLQATFLPLLLLPPADLDYLESKLDERLKRENEIHDDSD